jgi:cytochrome c5
MKRAIIMSTALAVLVLGAGQVAAAADGKAIYDKSCGSCHNKGVAKAPKLGDKAALKGDSSSMTAEVIKGKGIMQPRAGTKLSDEELKAAVDYMLAQAK